jgi:hypothetical protein
LSPSGPWRPTRFFRRDARPDCLTEPFP